MVCVQVIVVPIFWNKKADEKETVIAAAENCVIENINENIHSANLVEYSVPGFLPNVKQLEKQWRQATSEREEEIRQMTRLNWEA